VPAVRELQRTAGNRAVGAYLGTLSVQRDDTPAATQAPAPAAGMALPGPKSPAEIEKDLKIALESGYWFGVVKELSYFGDEGLLSHLKDPMFDADKIRHTYAAALTGSQATTGSGSSGSSPKRTSTPRGSVTSTLPRGTPPRSTSTAST